MEKIVENKSGHCRILFTGLLIFGLILPLSKSVSSITIGLISAYCVAIIIYDENFRVLLSRHIKQPLNAAIIFFVLIALMRSLFSNSILGGLNFVKQISNLFTVYLVTATLIDTEEDEQRRHKNAENLLFFFLIGIFMLDTLGFFSYFGLIGNKRGRLPFSPLNMHHIWAGNLNATGLYAAASLLLFSRHKKKSPGSIFLLLFLAVFMTAVLLSMSRTAWIGILVTVIVSTFFLIERKRIFFLAVFAVIAGAVSFYWLNNIVHSRINQIFNDVSLFSSGVASTSIGERFLMWKAATEMFLSNPLFGVGPGNYESTFASLVSAGKFPGYILKYNQPHSMYLFTLATMGLVGFSGLLFIFGRVLQKAGSLISGKERLFGFLALTISVHFMTAGLTESLLNIHVLTSVFALLLGLSVRTACRVG